MDGISSTINDIGNDRFKLKSNNDNANEPSKRKRDSSLVDSIAEKLVQEFGNEGYRDFYCKLAWRLPENAIWNLVEVAKEKGTTPGRLFTYLAKKELRRYGDE